jgi:hypothetical protein
MLTGIYACVLASTAFGKAKIAAFMTALHVNSLSRCLLLPAMRSSMQFSTNNMATQSGAGITTLLFVPLSRDGQADGYWTSALE